jgi:hypothetical protein
MTYSEHKNSLIKKQSIAEVVAHRTRAIECIVQAGALLDEADKAFRRAAESEYGLYWRDMPTPSSYGDRQGELKKWAQQVVDGRVWEYLLGASGLKNLMDAEAVSKFRAQVQKEPPECTIDNINATFSELNANKGETFVRGLINVFNRLDCRRYKTNDAFKITPKIILHRCLDSYGFSYYGSSRDAIGDLCRIMHILDGKEPKDHLGDLRALVQDARYKKQDKVESEYFMGWLYKNGNLHLQLKRLDLIEKANKLIAAHYGAALAQA